MAQDDQAVLRIGEVARRTGVSVSTLRAWERRYELLEPHRTDGGHRLYREADVARVRAMQHLVDRGWSASAAAREVRQGAVAPPPVTVVEGQEPAAVLTARLQEALDTFDAAAVDAVLDDAFARLTLSAALDEVVMPAMRWVGDGWEDDPRVIAREHVATNAVRPRLLRLLRTAVPTAGRVCIAATPEDEEHDVGVLAAAAVAASVGWRVHFLGSRTPRAALERAVAELGASVVLVAAVTEERARGFLDDRPDLGTAALILGGTGFAALDTAPADAFVHTGGFRPLPGVLEQAVSAARAS